MSWHWAAAGRAAVIAWMALLSGSAACAAPSAGARDGGPLPDSLLARVGTHRHVSLAEFRRSWHRVAPPQRPDSLTPASAREFLDLLIGKEVLAEVALRTPWKWTPAESADVRGLADRLTMKAMLDSALLSTYNAHVARGDTVRDLGRLGTLARDETLARFAVQFDTTLTRRLAGVWAAIPKPSRDSSLMAQLRVLGAMPNVAPADAGRVLARSNDGDFRVSDLVESWRRLDPLQRPRVSTRSQIEDVAGNALFERRLRRDAVERRVLEWPSIAAALDEQREYVAVTHLVAREVYDSLKVDTLALHRYYQAHRAEFDLPLRVRVLELDLETRVAASRMAVELRDAAQAESLMSRAHRRGTDYTLELTAERDSARFQRALAAGTGTVLGPDSSSAGWTVTRVLELEPARSRSFHEAAPLVYHAWYAAESERRMVATLARLRRTVPVTVNEPAIDRLAREGAGPAEPRPGGAGSARTRPRAAAETGRPRP